MSQPQPLVPCSRLAATALLVAIGHERLGGGRGVIGRWRVTPEDRARFLAFEAGGRMRNPGTSSTNSRQRPNRLRLTWRFSSAAGRS
jgi:hypothetical protein